MKCDISIIFHMIHYVPTSRPLVCYAHNRRGVSDTTWYDAPQLLPAAFSHRGFPIPNMTMLPSFRGPFISVRNGGERSTRASTIKWGYIEAEFFPSNRSPRGSKLFVNKSDDDMILTIYELFMWSPLDRLEQADFCAKKIFSTVLQSYFLSMDK